MNELSTYEALAVGLWELFSRFNGNPEYGNYGIRLSMGMFFSFYLFGVIKLRTISTMQRKHVVALIGALLIFIRYTVMFTFEWGYQIGLYSDPMVKFLFPPLEHYFYMLGLGCFAYYSLHHYQYYPGMLKKILWAIPILTTLFFIYSAVEWKMFFTSNLPEIRKFLECNVDWQSHAIIALSSLYVFAVSVKFPSKENNHYLSYFWGINFFEHSVRSIVFFQHIEPVWLQTIFHATQIWLLPLITFHFIKIYTIKLKFCEICAAQPNNPNFKIIQ